MRRGLAIVLAVLVVAPLALAQDENETRVRIDLRDEGCPAGPDRFCIRPSAVQVDEGEALVLEIENEGRVEHNLTAGPGVPAGVAEHVDVAPLAPNASTTVTVPWDVLSQAREETGEARLVLECGFDGHADLGERLTVTVGDPTAQRPQPGFGAAAALVAVGLVAIALGRGSRER